MSSPLPFGPFLLDSRIAVGGTAEVYLARPATADTTLPERLVVKRLLPHFAADSDGRTMFEREARLHAAVTHANVVTVFHAGVDDRGEPYLAMEYIDGVDGYRLLRRLRQDDALLPVEIAVYVACEVLRALESVHAARDPLSGGALGIVHRDVSPSNLYFSKDGQVKLGDFGIARSTTRVTQRSEVGQAPVLKGKFAYLAPEQVAGETSDHRADLFSLATVLAEILLNRPLFQGGGQLAILLAIRDCNIDALHQIRDRLPAGLFDVLSRALARNPSDRYPSATEFALALAPFEAKPEEAIRAIASHVRWLESLNSSDKLIAVRDTARRATSGIRGPSVGDRLATARPPREVLRPSHEGMRESVPKTLVNQTSDTSDRKTDEYEWMPSRVIKENGEALGPWTFARVMEALATGQVQRGDRVDFVGRGFAPVEEIEELQRFLAPQTATTGKLTGPGAPDFNDSLSEVSILVPLMRVLAEHATGVLFAERTDDQQGIIRKELYFSNGKLHHVASSNASELLGEYLVRRGKLERAELDLALAVLPRYGGRIGDTLISMGLVGPVDIFRAIREQGRDRVADLFLWKSGVVLFYRGQSAPHVEFPLDLDLPTLMLAGLEASRPSDLLMEEYRHHLDRKLDAVHSGSGALAEAKRSLANVIWPPLVVRIHSLVKPSALLRDVLKTAARANGITAGDALRAFELLLAAELVSWHHD